MKTIDEAIKYIENVVAICVEDESYEDAEFFSNMLEILDKLKKDGKLNI